ncbi:MAG TPA: hypothetical protein VGO93_16680 [Candidatus Xenobia bacterium]|jgi:hypothetical protein
MRLSSLLLAAALLLPTAVLADPVKVVSFSCSQNYIPNGQGSNLVHGLLVVRNASSQAVPDVTLQVQLRNRTGHVVAVDRQFVGTLRSGEQHTFAWQWLDGNHVVVTPLAQVTHARGHGMVSFVAHAMGQAPSPAEADEAPAYQYPNPGNGPNLNRYNHVPNAQATAPGSGASGQTPSP